MELSAAYLDVQIEADGAAGRQGGRKVPPNSNVGGVKMVGEEAHLLALRGVAHGKASPFAPLSSSAPLGAPHLEKIARGMELKSIFSNARISTAGRSTFARPFSSSE